MIVMPEFKSVYLRILKERVLLVIRDLQFIRMVCESEIFLQAGGKTIDLDWDRERGFIATEDKDKVGAGNKSEKSTFNLK
jgi:hypothetical protein